MNFIIRDLLKEESNEELAANLLEVNMQTASLDNGNELIITKEDGKSTATISSFNDYLKSFSPVESYYGAINSEFNLGASFNPYNDIYFNYTDNVNSPKFIDSIMNCITAAQTKEERILTAKQIENITKGNMREIVYSRMVFLLRHVFTTFIDNINKNVFVAIHSINKEEENEGIFYSVEELLTICEKFVYKDIYSLVDITVHSFNNNVIDSVMDYNYLATCTKENSDSDAINFMLNNFIQLSISSVYGIIDEFFASQACCYFELNSNKLYSLIMEMSYSCFSKLKDALIMTFYQIMSEQFSYYSSNRNFVETVKNKVINAYDKEESVDDEKECDCKRKKKITLKK